MNKYLVFLVLISTFAAVVPSTEALANLLKNVCPILTGVEQLLCAVDGPLSTLTDILPAGPNPGSPNPVCAIVALLTETLCNGGESATTQDPDVTQAAAALQAQLSSITKFANSVSGTATPKLTSSLTNLETALNSLIADIEKNGLRLDKTFVDLLVKVLNNVGQVLNAIVNTNAGLTTSQVRALIKILSELITGVDNALSDILPEDTASDLQGIASDIGEITVGKNGISKTAVDAVIKKIDATSEALKGRTP